jgi:hypothetical protein
MPVLSIMSLIRRNTASVRSDAGTRWQLSDTDCTTVSRHKARGIRVNKSAIAPSRTTYTTNEIDSLNEFVTRRLVTSLALPKTR